MKKILFSFLISYFFACIAMNSVYAISAQRTNYYYTVIPHPTSCIVKSLDDEFSMPSVSPLQFNGQGSMAGISTHSINISSCSSTKLQLTIYPISNFTEDNTSSVMIINNDIILPDNKETVIYIDLPGANTKEGAIYSYKTAIQQKTVATPTITKVPNVDAMSINIYVSEQFQQTK